MATIAVIDRIPDLEEAIRRNGHRVVVVKLPEILRWKTSPVDLIILQEPSIARVSAIRLFLRATFLLAIKSGGEEERTGLIIMEGVEGVDRCFDPSESPGVIAAHVQACLRRGGSGVSKL